MDVSGFYENLGEAVRHAAGDGPILLLWGLSLVYIWVFMPRARRVAAAITIMAVALINPLSGGLALFVVETSQPYSRFVWLLFPELLAAVVACDLVMARSRTALRAAVGLACMVMFVYSGHLLLSTEFFDRPTNEYQISQDALDVGDYLLAKQESEAKGGNPYAKKKAGRSEHTRAVVADALTYDIRQARSGVHLLYGRHGIKVKNRIESRLIASSDEEATRVYFEKLKKVHVTAIVLQTDEGLQAVMEHYGWVPETEIGGYTVYVVED